MAGSINFPRKVLIAGYFGFNNTGDEMILAGMVQDLRKLMPEISIVVASGNPVETNHLHNVAAVAWEDVNQINDVVKSCNLVILGGGGIFHDYWGMDSTTILTSSHIGIAFYSSIALLASIHKIPLMLYAVGVGPLLTEEGKLYVQAIADQAAVITVRDPESKEQLLALGISSDRIIITIDPAYSSIFAMEVDEIAGKEIQGDPILAVALRNWNIGVDSSQWETEVAFAIDDFLENHLSGHAVFVPFQELNEELLDDFGLAERIRHKLKHSARASVLEKSSTIQRKIAVIAQSDLVLGMRLHALIIAIKNKIPMVGLIYDPKIKNTMTRIGLEEYAIKLSDVTVMSLSYLLDKAYKNRESLTNQLKEISFQLESEASKNAIFAIELMKTGFSPNLQQKSMDLLAKTTINLSHLLDTREKHLEKMGHEIFELDNEVNNYLLVASNQKVPLPNKKEFSSNYPVEKNTTNQVGAWKHNEHSIELTSDLEKLKNDISELSVIHETRRKIEEKTISNLTNELDSIKKSRGWKLLLRFWQIRLVIIPHGSRREKFARLVVREIGSIKKNLIKFLKNLNNDVFRKFHLKMSVFAYNFLLYREERQKSWTTNLSKLHTPGEPGLVSIILPVFNGEKYLAEAIDSILNQTYTQFELIVIDDGSTDGSGKILQDYANRDSRIRVIHQENQKLPQALNNGFSLARGEYLTWTSHDNRLKPFFLAEMVASLSRHPAWDMVYANMDIIGDNGLPLKDSTWFSGYQVPSGSEHIHLPTDTSELNIWPNNFIGGAFLYRRRVAELLAGYSPVQFTREDYDYWMQVNSLLTVRHADFENTVYDYRFHIASLTHHDEELSITSDRKYLMVFEDFRRDFYRMPLIWVLDEASAKSEEKRIYDELSKALTSRGQIILPISEIQTLNLSHLFLPGVYIKIASDTGTMGDSHPAISQNFTKVLMTTGIQQQLEKLDDNWDIYLSLGMVNVPDYQQNEQKRVWTSSDLGTLITAVDIKCRSQHLRQIEIEAFNLQANKLKMSVVICTYMRNEILKKALGAIAHQSLPQSDYEVLIVDNNPDRSKLSKLIDEIRQADFYGNPGHLRLVHCPVQGLSFARNAGISEAYGRIILFMDDDSIAQNDLLEQYWKAFMEHPDAGVIGGHIRVQRPEHLSMIWKDGWERYWSQFLTGFSGYTAVKDWWDFPWGANWCASKKALMQIGGFRGRYGRQGDDFNGGEEIIAASLIQKLGYSVAILPQAEVIHQVDPSRFTLVHLRQTIQSALFSQYQSRLDGYIPAESFLRGSYYQYKEAANKIFKILKHPGDPENHASLLEISYILSARVKLYLKKARDDFKRIRFLFSIIK
jgi:polysaccharide pyruvyl transferase CsaB